MDQIQIQILITQIQIQIGSVMGSFGAVPTSLASDYNIFTSPGAGNRFKLSGNKTYTQWKALGIYDQHSTP